MTNFVKIGQSVAKILRFFDFSRCWPSEGGLSIYGLKALVSQMSNPPTLLVVYGIHFGDL